MRSRARLVVTCVLLVGLAACGSGGDVYVDAPTPDGAVADTGVADAPPDAELDAMSDGVIDGAIVDAGADGAIEDAGADGAIEDAGADGAIGDAGLDAAPSDAMIPDAPAADAPPPDAIAPDAAPSDAPVDAVIPDAAIPDAPSDAGPPMGGDDDLLWDHLYHAAGGVDPGAELVPLHAVSFRQPVGGPLSAATPVDVHVVAAYGDAAAMQLRVWIGAALVLPMEPIADVTASFRGQPEQRYLVWRGTIPAQPAGTTVYYRVQIADGAHLAVLKAAAGVYTNPLGQHVRGFDDAPDDYAYVVP